VHIKPGARKGLVIIGVLYAVTVAVMITDFVADSRPQYPERVTGVLQQKLNEVRQQAYAEDPKHIRADPVTQKEAASVLKSLLAAKGQIINVNYTLILQCLNFAILLMVMYGFLWDPLLAFLDERRRSVREQLDEAERREGRAADLVEQRRRELGQIHSERAGIIEKAQERADQQGEQIVERARREADRLRRDAQERLREELRRARTSLREEVADLSTLVAEKLLRRELTEDDHERLVRESIEQMSLEGDKGPEAQQ